MPLNNNKQLDGYPPQRPQQCCCPCCFFYCIPCWCCLCLFGQQPGYPYMMGMDAPGRLAAQPEEAAIQTKEAEAPAEAAEPTCQEAETTQATGE